MWKCLRSWFAWRFSLRRLLIATVLLGALVGLNFRRIGPTVMLGASWPGEAGPPINYYGWPLPWAVELDGDFWDLQRQFVGDVRSAENQRVLAQLNARHDAAKSYRYPLTHWTYCFFDERGVAWILITDLAPRRICPVFVYHGLFDVFFAMIVIALILFFRPRSKPPVAASDNIWGQRGTSGDRDYLRGFPWTSNRRWCI